MDIINRNPYTAPFFTDNVSIPGQPGGVHDTLICDHNGLVELHSTIQGTNGFVIRDTYFGQTRLTDFFNSQTGDPFR